MNNTLADLHRQKQAIEEALKSVHDALNSDGAKKPFSFQNPNSVVPSDFHHEILRDLVYNCERRKLGFDPEVVLQHIEKEAYRQFNDLTESTVKDQPVERLMELRHEIELFMLNDRAEFYPKQLAKIQAQIDAIEAPLKVDAHAELPEAPAKPHAKKKK